MNQTATIHIVDDDEAMRKSLTLLMKSINLQPRSYESAENFLDNYSPTEKSCILLDVRMPGMSGPELQEVLPEHNIHTPVIVMTGHGDINTAVKSMKAGAVDFIEKPFDHDQLINTIHNCIEMSASHDDNNEKHKCVQKLDLLTKRELEIFDHLVDGKINKVIASSLNLSVRTVEAHRANIMAKLHAQSLSDLVKMSIFSKMK